MDLRFLTDGLSVAPQIEPTDLPALAAHGFRAVICNRPDAEVPPALQASAIEAATREAGLEFRYIPYVPGPLTRDLLDSFAEALNTLPGPVLAYCRSGTRSCNLWALAEAGQRPAAEIVARGAEAGYDLSAHLPYLQAAEAK